MKKYILLFSLFLMIPIVSNAQNGTSFEINIDVPKEHFPKDGRLLILLSKNADAEPRFQIRDDEKTQLVFGMDIENLNKKTISVSSDDLYGYPISKYQALADGEYIVQALIHRYETFNRSDGHTVKLPMDRGEGQQWNKAPGNIYSAPSKMLITKDKSTKININKVIPPIEEPEDTKYVKHIKIQSKMLSEFWGRPFYLGAHVLLPEGFDEHPDVKYPLAIMHGHFPKDFGGFRTAPPDPNLKPEFSERFNLD